MSTLDTARGGRHIERSTIMSLTRVRNFLGRRHKLRGRGTRRFPVEAVNGNIGVYHIGFAHNRAQPKVL